MPSYTKTVWQDLPNTTTPVNATNLNKIEQGIYDNSEDIATINTNIGDLADLETSDTSSLVDSINSLTPEVLFENTSGTSSSITISNINSFKYIDVCSVCNGYHNTTRIYKENYTNTNNIISFYTQGNVFIIYCNNWSFSGDVFQRVSGYYLYMVSSGVREISTNSDHIKITKIIGYK